MDQPVKTFKDAIIHLKNIRNAQHLNHALRPLASNCIKIYKTIPIAFKQHYEIELVHIVKNIKIENPLSSEHYKAIEALNYEKEKLIHFSQTNTVFSTQALKIKDNAKYMKYDKGAMVRTLLNTPPSTPESMLLQNDVPIVQTKNGKLLPYIFETKYYPSSKYGSRGKDLNQLMKYQKAFELDLISGVTLDINGRLSSQFVSWLRLNKDLIPDVRMTFTIKLPSSKLYTVEIKPSNSKNITHPVQQKETYNDKLDLDIIAGIEYALKNDSFLDRMSKGMKETDLIYGTDQEKLDLTTKNSMGKLYINNPQDITNIDMYLCFTKNMQHFIWNTFVNLQQKPSCAEETFNIS